VDFKNWLSEHGCWVQSKLHKYLLLEQVQNKNRMSADRVCVRELVEDTKIT
jgi:hypothetical protein